MMRVTQPPLTAGPPRGAGPRAAGRQFASALHDEPARARWLREAWFASLSQLQPSSRNSFCSAWKTWLDFAGRFGGDVACQLPPRLGFLLAWANCFHVPGTYKNYLAHLKRACLLSARRVDVFAHPALKEARAGIERRRIQPRRQPRFIQREVLRAIAEACKAGKVPQRDFILMLLSYVFMLRVPSEAVPAVFSGTRFSEDTPSSVSFDGTRVGLKLQRRKNLQQGAPAMFRSCWCSACDATCPVHVLGEYLASLAPGAPLFPGIKPGKAIIVYRGCLEACGVYEAAAYGTHDTRRGHALDMLIRGGSLTDVLAAGQWISPEVILRSYLPYDRIEAAAVLEAAVAESGSEDVTTGAAAREPRQPRKSHSRTPADVLAHRARTRSRGRARAVAAAELSRSPIGPVTPKEFTRPRCHCEPTAPRARATYSSGCRALPPASSLVCG